jgi:NADPH:quinone reductase-like Zn-dependent oxidoreductase
VRAAGIERFGGDVRPLSLPDPRPPGAGETLIEVRAAAVAPWDDFVRAGSWDVGVSPPMALGVAAADGGRLARMAERLGNGEIALSVGKICGLAEAADALDLAVRGGGGGSVVLRL